MASSKKTNVGSIPRVNVLSPHAAIQPIGGGAFAYGPLRFHGFRGEDNNPKGDLSRPHQGPFTPIENTGQNRVGSFGKAHAHAGGPVVNADRSA
eukprot:903538-Pyramimonas_sp.AAC.1